MDWIKVGDRLPEENETVWACNENTDYVNLMCMVYEDGWLWAGTNGVIYSEDGKIVSECEDNDDYDITHWMALPELPKVSMKDQKAVEIIKKMLNIYVINVHPDTGLPRTSIKAIVRTLQEADDYIQEENKT